MEFCGKSWPVMPLLGHWVTHLHSKILERDPPTLDETLKLACRLETIARWSAAADDNFDDLGRRRDRLARGVGVGDDRGTADMARRIEQLSAAHKHYRGEVENLRERSSGMPLMPVLQHLGGKQTRAAAQRPSEGVSVDA